MIPIIVIVGPTAAGKSAVAERLAQECGGVIINADARQMYRDIDIVSAAPSAAERENMRLYAWKSVDEVYSFAQFVVDADREIADVYQAGKVPIVVGGTGLYVDALVKRFVPPPAVLPEIREYVQQLSTDAVLEELRVKDVAALNTIDVQNPRRVQRALEVVLQTGKSITSFGDSVEQSPYIPLIVGWSPDRTVLHKQIAARVAEMWKAGAVDEVRALVDAGHTMSEPGMQAIGIAEIVDYLKGGVSATEAQQRMIERTRQYARRQLTWFRRDKNIIWYTNFDQLWHSVHIFLQANYKQF